MPGDRKCWGSAVQWMGLSSAVAGVAAALTCLALTLALLALDSTAFT